MKFIIHYLTCAIFTAQILLYPTLAYADEQVTTLNVGDAAPFAGTLFNTEAAARLLTDLEFTQESCNIKIEAAVKTSAAEYQFKLDKLQASLDYCTSTCESRLEIKNDQIVFLQDELNKRKGLSPGWTFVGGVVAGSLLAIGTAYAYGQVVQVNVN